MTSVELVKHKDIKIESWMDRFSECKNFGYIWVDRDGSKLYL